MPEHRAVAAATGWNLMVPAGWSTLPTDAVRRDGAIKALLDRKFAGTARDELIKDRIKLDRRLRAEVARAAETGVTQIHALTDPAFGLPISASLLVADVVAGDRTDAAGEIASLLGPGEGVVEVERLLLGDLTALRRRRRSGAAMAEGEELPDVWQTHVDYVIEAGSDRLLILMFATVTDIVADELVEVFDSIAATLHRPGDGELQWTGVAELDES